MLSRSNTYRGHGTALVIALLSLVIGGSAVVCASAPVETIPACVTPHVSGR